MHSPLPERWYEAQISHVAVASCMTGDWSQAVAVAFAGGDIVIMNHPEEGRAERGPHPWSSLPGQEIQCSQSTLDQRSESPRCSLCLPRSVPTVWSECGPVPHESRLARPRTHL